MRCVRRDGDEFRRLSYILLRVFMIHYMWQASKIEMQHQSVPVQALLDMTFTHHSSSYTSSVLQAGEAVGFLAST